MNPRLPGMTDLSDFLDFSKSGVRDLTSPGFTGPAKEMKVSGFVSVYPGHNVAFPRQYLGFYPTDKLVEWINANMLGIDYDTISVGVIVFRSRGKFFGHLHLKHGQIIGGHLITKKLRLDNIPGLVFEETE